MTGAEPVSWPDINRAIIEHEEHLDRLAELRHDDGTAPGTVYYFSDAAGGVRQVIVHCGPYAFLPSRWEAVHERVIEPHVFLYES